MKNLPEAKEHRDMMPVRSDRPEKNSGETFEDAFAVHYPPLVRYLTYLSGDRSLAEDAAQEAFVKLYTTPPATRENLGGWLRRVGQHLALNYLRGEKRRCQRETRANPPGPPRVVPLEEGVLRKEEVSRVRQVLDQLPQRDRAALLLRYSGCRYAEIADLLEIPLSSVGTVLARAQKKFAALYGGKGE